MISLGTSVPFVKDVASSLIVVQHCHSWPYTTLLSSNSKYPNVFTNLACFIPLQLLHHLFLLHLAFISIVVWLASPTIPTSRSSCNGTHRCRNATGRWASPCDLSPVRQILDCMRPSQHVLGANMATVFLRLLPYMTPCPPQLSWTSMSLACPLKFSCLLRILESFLWRLELREVDNELHYCCCTSE